jgi:hypothetical protein
MTNSVASLSVCCLIVLVLLLPAPHGASSHTSHELGSGQIFPNKTHGKSSGNSQQGSTVSTATTTSSSSIATGTVYTFNNMTKIKVVDLKELNNFVVDKLFY